MPPIFVVQHMPEDFVPGFAARLSRESLMQTSVPEHNEIAQPGRAYIAPGNQHLLIDVYLGDLRMRLSDDEAMSGHRPSADKMFHSLADNNIPALGVIMTGMGADGTLGLIRMHEQNCHIIGQDESSCAVYGMPKMAFQAGAVDQEMTLGKLPVYINNLFSKISKKGGR
ncbi:MAG: chemotaxis protein CheB [Planctomycetes bacterium]|nr:chemotaxis protein CheB [Planctomycetota bacterium]